VVQILTSFASTIDESNDHNNRRRIDNDSHSHNGPSDGTQAGGKGGKAALGNTKAIRPNQTNVSNLKKLFDVFDIEGVGVITLDSLRKPRKGVDPVFLREVMSNLQNVPNTSADGSPITLTFNELMLDYVFSDCSPEQKGKRGVEDTIVIRNWFLCIHCISFFVCSHFIDFVEFFFFQSISCLCNE
jgi:hypothetical protein